LKKKKFKKDKEKIRDFSDFSSCYRAVDDEDTRRFKSGMMFSSSDRAALSLRFDRDSLFFLLRYSR
jgi:CCR4-NOT transcriptional regulation complex NOT5 subunit